MSLAGPGFETWIFLTLLCDFWKVTQTLYRSLMCVSHSEFWSGLPFPSPGDLSNPGIEPRSPALEGDSLLSKPPGKPPNRSLLFATPWTVAYQVHGIFQARILEWVAIPFCRGSSQPRDRTQVSRIVGRCFTI